MFHSSVGLVFIESTFCGLSAVCKYSIYASTFHSLCTVLFTLLFLSLTLFLSLSPLSFCSHLSSSLSVLTSLSLSLSSLPFSPSIFLCPLFVFSLCLLSVLSLSSLCPLFVFSLSSLCLLSLSPLTLSSHSLTLSSYLSLFNNSSLTISKVFACVPVHTTQWEVKCSYITWSTYVTMTMHHPVTPHRNGGIAPHNHKKLDRHV